MIQIPTYTDNKHFWICWTFFNWMFKWMQKQFNLSFSLPLSLWAQFTFLLTYRYQSSPDSSRNSSQREPEQRMRTWTWGWGRFCWFILPRTHNREDFFSCKCQISARKSAVLGLHSLTLFFTIRIFFSYSSVDHTCKEVHLSTINRFHYGSALCFKEK